MFNFIYKSNAWYDRVPEPKRFLVLFTFVSLVIIAGKIFAHFVHPIFNDITFMVLLSLLLYRNLYNIILKFDKKKNNPVCDDKLIAKENVPIHIGRELIGHKLIADKNVPELIEHGINFFKDKEYLIHDVRGNMVDLIDEYGDKDSFSVDEKLKGVNYLWDWFRKE